MDGREFIREVFKRNYDDPMPPVPPPRLSARKQEELKRRQRELLPARSLSSAKDAPKRKRITQFLMNLPATAMEFLDAFRGVLNANNTDGRGLSGIYDSQDKMPMIHCYGFIRQTDDELAVAECRKVREVYPRGSCSVLTGCGWYAQRAETALGGPLVGKVTWRRVRDVAPSMDMFCLGFQLPYDVAYAPSP